MVENIFTLPSFGISAALTLKLLQTVRQKRNLEHGSPEMSLMRIRGCAMGLVVACIPFRTKNSTSTWP